MAGVPAWTPRTAPVARRQQSGGSVISVDGAKLDRLMARVNHTNMEIGARMPACVWQTCVARIGRCHC